MRRLLLVLLVLFVVALLVLLQTRGTPDAPPTVPEEVTPVDPGPLPAKSDAAAGETVDPTRTGRLRIFVRSGAGPIPAARVEVRAEHGPARNVRADAEGVVALDAVPAGWAGVRVKAEGFSPRDARVQVPLGGLVEARMYLHRPRVLTGMVVTHEGDPVSGAKVRLFESAGAYLDGEGWEPLDRPMGETTTNAEGRFRAEDLPGGTIESALFLVVAEGFRTTTYHGKDGIRLTLAPGSVVEGRVVAGGDRPIAGARVQAVPVSCEYLWRDDGARRRSCLEQREEAIAPIVALSDSDGRYRLAGLGLSEPYLLRFFADGFTVLELSGVRIPAEGFDVTLVPGGSVRATVRDEEGRPIPGARVQVTGPWTRWFPGAETGADGSARVGALPFGRLNVRGMAAGFKYADVKVELPRGGDAMAELVLVRQGGRSPQPAAPPTGTATLAGRAVFQDGEPVSRGFVTVRPHARRTAIEPDGSFRIDFLPAGEVEVFVDPHRGMDVVTAASLPGTPLSVVVPRMRGLRGRLVLPPGERAPRMVAVRYQGGATSFYWDSDADGACPFQLSCKPGPQAVEFRPEGYRPLVWNGEIPESGALAIGDLTLDPGRALTGRVLDEIGVPVANAEVGVGTPDAFTQRVRTGLSGEFRLTGFGSAATSIFVDADGFLTVHETVAVDAGRVEIVLSRGVEVEVSVRTEAGLPIRGAAVTLERDSAGEIRYPKFTGSDGRATWRVEPGTYRVTARVPATAAGGRKRSATKELVLQAGRPVERVILVPR